MDTGSSRGMTGSSRLSGRNGRVARDRQPQARQCLQCSTMVHGSAKYCRVHAPSTVCRERCDSHKHSNTLLPKCCCHGHSHLASGCTFLRCSGYCSLCLFPLLLLTVATDCCSKVPAPSDSSWGSGCGGEADPVTGVCERVSVTATIQVLSD